LSRTRRSARLLGAEIAIMAAKKSKTKKATSRAAASRKPRKTAPKKKPAKSVRKRAKPGKTKKRARPRTSPAPRVPPPPPVPPALPKTFAEKVRDCDRGTEVWFRVRDESVHGVILDRSALGAAVLTDAGLIDPGVVVPVPLANLFESAEAERAAR
jgi:hypothetical protein